MSATVIIPARLGSVRFPGKVLANASGRPLVQHVVDRVRHCKQVSLIIVAADDAQIADALSPFGTRVVLTDKNHPSGTDRVAEVARSLDDSLIINVQGDEPEIEPESIDALIDMMESTGRQMGTLVTRFPCITSRDRKGAIRREASMSPIDGHTAESLPYGRGSLEADVLDPNRVKAVIAADGRAIYFSRSPIPYPRDDSTFDDYYLHLGVYAYQRNFLLEYASWPPSRLEQIEKLEQLRALEHNVDIGVVVVASATSGVDTPEQYQQFLARVGSPELPATKAPS